jgi:GTP cyclohydrolase IA
LTNATTAEPAKTALPVRPTREAAEAAVRTLLAWAGDDPARAGLKDTPKRVTQAYDEYFAGYRADAGAELATTFEETSGYRDMVLLRDIRFASHCEHHIAPFIGRAHVAYIPNGRIVGLSKLARVVEIFAHRLQTQENLTAVIADTIEAELQTGGVAVMLSAEHQCMSLRGVRQPGVSTVTSRYLGAFELNGAMRDRFLSLVLAPR